MACAQAPQQSEPVSPPFDIAAVKAHIHQANGEYGKRFLTADSSWYAARYCENACILPDHMPTLCGRNNLRDYYYNQGKNKILKLTITETQVFGNGDNVTEEGVYELFDDKGNSLDKGKFIALWKPENGAWKLYREIWNSDLPPAKP